MEFLDPEGGVHIPEEYQRYSYHDLALSRIPTPTIVAIQDQLQFELDATGGLIAYCRRLRDAACRGFPLEVDGQTISAEDGVLLFSSPFMLSEDTRACIFHPDGRAAIPRIAEFQSQVHFIDNVAIQQSVNVPSTVWYPPDSAYRLLTALCAAKLLQCERDQTIIATDPFWMKEKNGF